MKEWSFKTRRFKVEYTRTAYLSYALVHRVPQEDWPIASAVDIGNKKTRQCLVREACSRATDRLIRDWISKRLSV